MTDALAIPKADELLLAREIEICVGPYHSSEARREALANILLITRTTPPTHLARVINIAVSLTGLGTL